MDPTTAFMPDDPGPVPVSAVNGLYIDSIDAQSVSTLSLPTDGPVLQYPPSMPSMAVFSQYPPALEPTTATISVPAMPLMPSHQPFVASFQSPIQPALPSPIPTPSASIPLQSYSPPSAQLDALTAQHEIKQSATTTLHGISQIALKGIERLRTNKADEAYSTYQDIQQQIHYFGNLINELSRLSLTIEHEHPDLLLIDDSRKRCGSVLGQERPLKALRPLKAEPVDLPLPTVDVNQSSTIVSQTNGFASAPVSRPASPPLPQKGRKQSAPNGFPPLAPAVAPAVPPPVPAQQFPSHPTYFRATRSENVVPTRHSYSHSTGSISWPNGSVPQRPPNVRATRSGSVSSIGNPYPDFSSQWCEAPTQIPAPQADWPSEPPSPADPAAITGSALPSHTPSEEEEDEDEDEALDEDDADFDGSSFHSPTCSNADSIPPEYRFEVDRIFIEFLNKLCSNLEATSPKGEAIHQTLMAKKMRKLEESKEFRPFKFRIHAFTTAFLDELAQQGYGEDKIPMKKIRNYLWRQPLIMRYNADGKKAKSKGNHVWNVMAKRLAGNKWVFQEYSRKITVDPPGVAYIGLEWKWSPHIWDPQSSFQNVLVHFSSPSLPPWLSWKENVLSGVPPVDATSCDITAIAKFIYDGQEKQLSQTFHLNIAPHAFDHQAQPFPPSRPSLVGIPRYHTDPYPMTAPPPLVRPFAPEEKKTVAVLQKAAQKLQADVIRATPQAPRPEMNDLMKQRIALDKSLKACDKITKHTPTTAHDRLLASAAGEVVAEAAQAVVAPLVAQTQITTPSNQAAIEFAPVENMANLAVGAVAAAVKMVDNPSDDLQVITTAKNLLKQQNIVKQTGHPVQSPQNIIPSPIQPMSPVSVTTTVVPGIPSPRSIPLSTNSYPVVIPVMSRP